MADIQRAKPSAFEATLQSATRMTWPGSTLAPTDDVGFEPGSGDLLLLSYAPSRRFLGREPVHESLMLEIRESLAASSPGPLHLGRAVYRAGTERLAYQATRVMGTLSLVEATPKRYTLELTLSFVAPELDLDGAGGHNLSGQVTVARR